VADAIDAGDFVGAERHLPLWWEWERETKGRRAIVWSRGLRALFCLREDDDDGEVLPEETPPDVVGEVHPRTWALLVRTPRAVPDLLRYIATHDVAHVRENLPYMLDDFHRRAMRARLAPRHEPPPT